ncbi:MAG TPA: hypothetical protein VIC53_00675 [Wenzhouxiangella sp.]
MSLFRAHGRATQQTKASGSVVALDWNDRHAVLGWLPERAHAPEIQTHAIPEGLMIHGQWQDEQAWRACLETWVAATKISQPLMVVALPAQDLVHHWIKAEVGVDIDPDMAANIDSSHALNSLVDHAMVEHALTEQGAWSPIDQVFDVLPESDLWPGQMGHKRGADVAVKNTRWCLLGASQAKVSSYEALFASSHLRLACVDGRPRALLGCLQQRVSNKGLHCVLDDHLGTTQWWVTSESGVNDFGQFSHQRLSLVERVDHLTQRLATPQANFGLDAMWVSNGQHDQATDVASQVAQALGLELVLMPPVNGHEESASQQAVVQGLLAKPLERETSHAL